MKERCSFASCFIVAAVVSGVVKLMRVECRASTGVGVTTWKNGGMVPWKKAGVAAWSL
jgi:hypothetical protein